MKTTAMNSLVLYTVINDILQVFIANEAGIFSLPFHLI